MTGDPTLGVLQIWLIGFVVVMLLPVADRGRLLALGRDAAERCLAAMTRCTLLMAPI